MTGNKQVEEAREQAYKANGVCMEIQRLLNALNAEREYVLTNVLQQEPTKTVQRLAQIDAELRAAAEVHKAATRRSSELRSRLERAEQQLANAELI